MAIVGIRYNADLFALRRFRVDPEGFDRPIPDRLIKFKQRQIVGNTKRPFAAFVDVVWMNESAAHTAIGRGPPVAPPRQKLDLCRIDLRVAFWVKKTVCGRQNQTRRD